MFPKATWSLVTGSQPPHQFSQRFAPGGILADTKAPAEERAVYLSWLIHLIGDEHMTADPAWLTTLKRNLALRLRRQILHQR
jgi:hypothetical protein